ncbi:MAG TPA: TetR/AcrR family transcriptional regulator [Acinetobacter sp.]|nr:TetR/AcrR family transcriptional regulator [Acinetobacter sp.]HQW52945.1 TetR/AcrR family transcriptional regulator [Acinetobacter sp.]HQZ59148.1 TetR/AcrR family transcriptional regulator [Acinetobacter sp.]HRA91916.1 TetR/AcrR family transcriptional regulator [Acinetobacter sp.]
MSNLDRTIETVNKRVYRKKNPEDRVLERRERLMQAALQLFGTQGYANTTIETLCSEAKVTTRHFYQVFSSREELLLAVYNQITEELQVSLFSAMMAERQGLQEKMQQVIQALVNNYLTDSRRAQIGVLEVVGASAIVEKRRREVIHGIAIHLEQFMNALAAENQLPQRNYHWLAVALVGGINELMAEWLMNQSLSLEQLTDEIFYLINMFMAGKN